MLTPFGEWVVWFIIALILGGIMAFLLLYVPLSM